MDARCRHPVAARSYTYGIGAVLRWFCGLCGKPDLAAPRRVTVKG